MAKEQEKFNDLQLSDRLGELDLLLSSSGDLKLVRGTDCIVQGLLLRLQVRKGELAPLGWPNYGSRLHELIGEPNNARTHVMLMAHARTAIEQDPRVVKVKEMRVIPKEQNVVQIQMEILLKNESKPLNLGYQINLEGL
ncbi:GPW/gp25 family protein [Tolypothrix bouteillei VB521301_2]|uniref:Uncharacterized protein n=1 Tax=Tolypothrix bouteillei VB521301 TaxID=1479485 RepID=A0A0C1NG82_9CYAN